MVERLSWKVLMTIFMFGTVRTAVLEGLGVHSHPKYLLEANTLPEVNKSRYF